MLDFFRKKYSFAESGLLKGLTDHHSHLLPGVDDGFKQTEQTLKALEEMEKQGIAEVWLTPHIMEDIPNTPDSLKSKFEVLKKSYHGNIRLNLAAENMLDNLFIQRFEENNLLLMNGNRILVETSYFNPPMEFDGLIGDILNKGYWPLLAHPERYKYMDENKYRQLKERGVLFQLNLGAIVGGYSPETQAKAKKILQNGWYDCLGSDIHSFKHLITIINSKALTNKEIQLLEKLTNSNNLP